MYTSKNFSIINIYIYFIDIFLFGNYLRYLTTDSNSDHRTAVNEFNSMLVAEERKSKKPQNGISFTPRQTPARDKDNISTIYNYGSDGPLNAGYIMTHDKDKLMEFLNEAQYNLTTHVMSNGIKVIIASDIGKPPIVTKTTATEVASKNSLHEKLRLRIGSRKAAYSRATTLAPSTLKDQMILVQPSKWISPTKFSLPYNLNQFVTKTCFTTYTYRTTYLQNGSPTVESREQVISNIATEKRNYLRMAPLISLGVILSQNKI
ncbi:unnamed protein product [Ceratitis capitata]|uniref:(Mediterranean fruit fly) hypothetical protein n=1 Tax=Ceratitis capitata TaxID=7213 RepID=A0A811UUT6_CERCA|nr:unnamed protein product [Ceratitis capitata]